MSRGWRIAGLVWLCGCQGGVSLQKEQAAGQLEVRGPVVARVEGEPIGLQEVQEVVAATGLDPKVALIRLQQERLLTRRAERAGYGRRASVAQAVRRARVRALLIQHIERQITPQSISFEQVQERYRALGEKVNRPEKRAVYQVLFKVAPGEDDRAQRAAAERVVRQWSETDDPSAVYALYSGRREHDGLRIKASREGPFADKSPLGEAFRDAAFRLGEPGVVPEPVRSRYGWHAVYVTEVVPAWAIPIREVESEIRQQLMVEARSKRLDKLLDELQEDTVIQFEDETIQRVFAGDLLLSDSPP